MNIKNERIDYEPKPDKFRLTDPMVENCESCGHIAALHKSHGCSGSCKCRGFRGAQRRAYLESPTTESAINFLKRAATENARIVSSGDLHSEVIIEARANNRFWVDPETGLGWALIPWELSTMKDRKREADYFLRNGMLT